jgi:hypothetical protein
MSWSLEINNGDLTTPGARLGQVAHGAKLVQDLRCALLERRGNDDMHPTFGSMIDGGRDEFGNEVQSIIGTHQWDFIAMRVEGEVRRICAEHQQRQLDRAKADRLTYGESTLGNDELLIRIGNFSMTQAQDRLLVQITLETGSGSHVLNIPITDTNALSI